MYKVHFHQLQVWGGVITACSLMHGGLYIIDKSTGVVLLKCASKLKNGNLGQFSEPRITHSGFDGSLMVADPGNRCLQVKTLTGEWGIVPMEFACYRPVCALLHRKDLFVGQGTEPYKIFRYI